MTTKKIVLIVGGVVVVLAFSGGLFCGRNCRFCAVPDRQQ